MSIVEQLLLYVFVVTGLINTIHLGLYIAGANVYDIRQYRRLRNLKKRLGHKLPEVAVVIPAHNEALVIRRCLDSVRRTKYPRLTVYIHNDNSTDETAAIVRAYQKEFPKFHLRIVNRRKRAGKAGGVNYCIQKYVTSELVMTLDADCALHPKAIHNAVRYFKDEHVVGVAANVRILDKWSVLGVLQQFEHMIGYRSKKFFTVTNCEFIVGGVASTYRRDILEKVGYYGTDTLTEDIGLSMKVVALGNRNHRVVYAADVVAMAEGVHSFVALLQQRFRWKMGSLQNLLLHRNLIGNRSRAYSRALTWYRMPMAIVSELILLVQPLVLGYIFYLSIVYNTIGFFFGAYLTITLYVLATIWPDEHMTTRDKLAKSLYAPFLYFAFYIMDTVQIVAIIRCLINPKALTLKNVAKDASWTSPARIGQEVKFS
ncbi:MAG TPA: glycosyltransferase [Candidatus Saccharimonadales bacterium]|nr:glycosyltransferase [Candidatus Saccharimonadales bacterium]